MHSASAHAYRRAVARRSRRSRAYVQAANAALNFSGPALREADRRFALLVEASHLIDRLAVLAFGTPEAAASSLLHHAFA